MFHPKNPCAFDVMCGVIINGKKRRYRSQKSRLGFAVAIRPLCWRKWSCSGAGQWSNGKCQIEDLDPLYILDQTETQDRENDMSSESDRECREVQEALDRYGLETEMFTGWMESQGFRTQMPYCGTFSMQSQNGRVAFVHDNKDGVSRVVTCVYTPADVNDGRWTVEGRPDRPADYYRMLRNNAPPWPGSVLLSHGGVSVKGTRIPTDHLKEVEARIEEARTMPVEELAKRILAFLVGAMASELDLDEDLDFLDSDTFTLQKHMEDMFGIRILSEETDEWKNIQDVIDAVKQKAGR